MSWDQKIEQSAAKLTQAPLVHMRILRPSSQLPLEVHHMSAKQAILTMSLLISPALAHHHWSSQARKGVPAERMTDLSPAGNHHTLVALPKEGVLISWTSFLCILLPLCLAYCPESTFSITLLQPTTLPERRRWAHACSFWASPFQSVHHITLELFCKFFSPLVTYIWLTHHGSCLWY